ncbi:hypothetical protein GOP47_0012019 [Adiantum capillus-veneris]|uniref:Pentatricopeptide repeat-containing protein n=1 Tax=Adiantum capillus-veneris TaxID=13818 RepID=A0A9D4ZIC0_ADICA|nr:hypothetical protein GOP47_0012019 [Adiantum capillus-veneris]
MGACAQAAQIAFPVLEQTFPHSSEGSHGLKLVKSVCEKTGLYTSAIEHLGHPSEWVQPSESSHPTPLFVVAQEQTTFDDPSFDRDALISSLQDCPSLAKGRFLHSVVVELGLAQDFLLANILIQMYNMHGDLDHACRVFHLMDYRTIVSWNTIIMAYSVSGNIYLSLQFLQQMLHHGVEPDQATFVCLLIGFTTPDVVEAGKLVHTYVIKLGLSFDVKIGNALISMYAKCGSLGNACAVFEAMPSRNVITWTALITAHCHHGCCKDCFNLFKLMEQNGMQPNDVTFISILGACVDASALGEGIKIHASVVENGYFSAVMVVNALINMYGKCGSLHDAYLLFQNMHNCNVDSWNAIICVCLQHRQCGRALQLFKEMHCRNYEPNEVSFLVALGACSTPSVIDEGMVIHSSTIASGLVDKIAIKSALITMYSKCGTLEMVQILFDSVENCDLVLWTAAITGYAQHGHSKIALQLFAQMQQEGWEPNSVTFLCLLSACSHAGLVDEGCLFFNTMVKNYKLTPDVDHFSCVIDLLGKAGRIVEAASMIFKLFARSSSTVWRTFLAACRLHGNFKQAQWAAERLLDAKPDDVSIYALLSNIYTANGQDVDVETVNLSTKL